nr:zinc finger, CCHC-type [Tanacetum cinerariifolium]
MDAQNQNANALTLRSLTEKEKLNGTNFLDWHRNLRIILEYERKLTLIKEPLPNPSTENAPVEAVNAYQELINCVF